MAWVVSFLHQLKKKWYIYPSPIQAQVIPLLLKGEKRYYRTSSDWYREKQLLFALPILERLEPESTHIQALILTPTRELAIQVAEEIKSFSNSNISIQLLYGGQNMRDEIMGLKRKPQIVVWTPGRVIDHLTKKKTLKIENIKYFVLDEADEMLNIGFKDDIEEIIEYTPKEKKSSSFFQRPFQEL